MSRSVFVRCRTGNNAFADCEIYRRGDLLRLVGYSQMDFTREDALQLAENILTMYRTVGQTSDEIQVGAKENEPESSENERLSVALAVRLGVLASAFSENGISCMDTLDAIRAIQNTTLAGALFLERLHEDLERTISDGR